MEIETKMKKLLMLLVALSCYVGMQAQDVTGGGNGLKRGFRGIAELGYEVATNKDGENSPILNLSAGYQLNPYKYVAKCDLFVCASYAEGFSTAATEALIVGTPVCTVEVSGMREMLGSNNEWGIITQNNDEALYQGIKQLLDDPKLLQHYKRQAIIRGRDFSTVKTVQAVEQMLLQVSGKKENVS